MILGLYARAWLRLMIDGEKHDRRIIINQIKKDYFKGNSREMAWQWWSEIICVALIVGGAVALVCMYSCGGGLENLTKEATFSDLVATILAISILAFCIVIPMVILYGFIKAHNTYETENEEESDLCDFIIISCEIEGFEADENDGAVHDGVDDMAQSGNGVNLNKDTAGSNPSGSGVE